MRELKKEELKLVSGACYHYDPYPDPVEKGNNGWGNGGNDGIPGNSSKDPNGQFFKEPGDSDGQATTGGGQTKVDGR